MGRVTCTAFLANDVVDLINRYKIKIERLQKENILLSRKVDTAFQDGINEYRQSLKRNGW